MTPPTDSQRDSTTVEWRLHQLRTDRGQRVGVFVSDEQAVLLRLAVRGGSLALVELHLVPLSQLDWITGLRPAKGDDGAPITARALRQLPLGDLTERLAREVVTNRSSVAGYPEALAATFAASYGLSPASVDGVRSLVAGLRGDNLVLLTVAVYLEAAAGGDPAPAASTSELLGVTPKSVHSRLSRARAEGWLSTAGAGRSGGSLSPEARRRILKVLGGRNG